jgi:hypothetical protein
VNWAGAIEEPMIQTPNTVSNPEAPDWGAGNRSRFADVEGRVGIAYKNGPWSGELGGGYWYGVNRYNVTGTPVDISKRLAGADLQIAIPYLKLRGEIFTATNADSYWASFGKGVIEQDTNPRAARTSGGWGQIVLEPTEMVQLYFGGGGEKVNAEDIVPGTSGAPIGPGTLHENQQYAAGLIVYPSKHWHAGLEWGHTISTYWIKPTGSSAHNFDRVGNQLALSMAYVF